MDKIILSILLLTLVGCGGQLIKTTAQETYVPILYCPAPPKITRPTLPIHEMTPEQLKIDGEVVKFYKASILVLQGYSRELEQALDQYNNTNAAYDELRKKLINNIKAK